MEMGTGPTTAAPRTRGAARSSWTERRSRLASSSQVPTTRRSTARSTRPSRSVPEHIRWTIGGSIPMGPSPSGTGPSSRSTYRSTPQACARSAPTDTEKGAADRPPLLLCQRYWLMHVAVAAGGRRRLVLLLGLLHHGALRGQHERGDGGGVLEGRPGDLGGIHDPGPHQVRPISLQRIEAGGVPLRPDPLDHHGALVAGVGGNETGRLAQRGPDDPRPGGLIALELQGVQAFLDPDQRNPAARDDPFLDGRPSGRQGVLDPMLLLLQLHLG